MQLIINLIIFFYCVVTFSLCYSGQSQFPINYQTIYFYYIQDTNSVLYLAPDNSIKISILDQFGGFIATYNLVGFNFLNQPTQIKYAMFFSVNQKDLIYATQEGSQYYYIINFSLMLQNSSSFLTSYNFPPLKYHCSNYLVQKIVFFFSFSLQNILNKFQNEYNLFALFHQQEYFFILILNKIFKQLIVKLFLSCMQ
ncbi:transmembrane protein, putative (macronuclear) [Tetrahymena thermophila SB210]|uniref:Transmembrane protein, putative n=1 Tax=Tetrahymena thermophila (strain SB210) TaxID=312017 RepID=W7WYT1_TETTS|nr:transmembrane protein, putative [Tetrahymena thermophila SB210]EWS72060.1 transmembrane protein, putative [Tetrahymena thermophila SB210]|eukprot:XP_012655371.1 transmembrane protein, putative [Tetrahymena thermophila SB210]